MCGHFKHQGSGCLLGGRERTELEMEEWYTVGVSCNRLPPEDLKQTRQNVKLLLSWYVGVHYVNVILCTFMCT